LKQIAWFFAGVFGEDWGEGGDDESRGTSIAHRRRPAEAQCRSGIHYSPQFGTGANTVTGYDFIVAIYQKNSASPDSLNGPRIKSGVTRAAWSKPALSEETLPQERNALVRGDERREFAISSLVRHNKRDFPLFIKMLSSIGLRTLPFTYK